MPDPANGQTTKQKLDDICDIHMTPMVKHMEHVGDGKSEWSTPYCPLCVEIEEREGEGSLDKIRASVKAEDVRRAAAKTATKEQPAQAAVKPAAPEAAAPAAKT